MRSASRKPTDFFCSRFTQMVKMALVMRSSLFLLLIALPLADAFSQPAGGLTLSACYEQAREAHPLSARGTWLLQANALQLEQIEAGRKPTIQWKAAASIQSEVVDLPFQAPGIEPINLPLYRAQSTVEANYLLYDGGLTDARQAMESSALLTRQQEVEVSLEQLKAQINQAYFGILQLRAQREILLATHTDLQNKLGTVQAGVRHGAVLETEADKLEVEIYRLDMRQEETEGQLKGLVAVLGALIGEELSPEVVLILPESDEGLPLEEEVLRPELRLFDLQKQEIQSRQALVDASRRPKVAAFAQAGLGYPNPLNFFDESLSPFGVAGVNFTWDIVDWKKADRDRELISVQQALVDNQREVFLKNLSVQDGRYREELASLDQLIERDRQVMELQEKILSQTSAQLDHGVITASEYLTQVNALLQSRLQLEAHRIRREQVKVDFLTHKGLL